MRASGDGNGYMSSTDVIELVARVMEGLGVAVILFGTLLATVTFLRQWRQRTAGPVMYRTYRRGLAQAILLGLEFLVGGDIIRTVAIQPTLTNVGVLAAIVAIRTVLSLSMQLEIEGRWPWQQPATATAASVQAEEIGDGRASAIPAHDRPA